MKSLAMDLETVTHGPASLQDPHECNEDHIAYVQQKLRQCHLSWFKKKFKRKDLNSNTQ